MTVRALGIAAAILFAVPSLAVLAHFLSSCRKDVVEVDARETLVAQLRSDDMETVKDAAEELARQEEYLELFQAIGLEYQSYLVLLELTLGVRVPIKGFVPPEPPQIEVLVSVLRAAGVRAHRAIEAAAKSEDPGLRWAARRVSGATGTRGKESPPSPDD
jgi:hypothetical protein